MSVSTQFPPDAAPPGYAPSSAVAPRARTDARSYFRTDVEGLRAIAVFAVVAFHASVPGFSGGFVGVDIFFVISGFLITGLLVREAQSTGRISFTNFFARRARRILPAATLVLLVTTVASLLVQPLLGVYDATRGILASGLYLANWHFISIGTDYFAQGLADSPVLHYWSLAVEEQFYLVWPLIVLGAFTLAKRAPLIGSRIITWCVVGVTLASLTASIVLTATDPELAYMATHTRAWEFGIGAIVATVSHWLQLESNDPRSPRIGWLVGWLGLAAIVFSVLFYEESMPFPGATALVPTLGTAAIIAGGILAGTGGTTVGGLLSLRPIRYIGRVSFGWYLWHWPVLILAESALGELTWQLRSILMVGALLLAVATLHLVELPLNRWKQVARKAGPALALGLLCMVLATTSSLAVGSAAVSKLSSANANLTVDASNYAEVFGPDTGANSGPVSPNPIDAPDDAPTPDGCLLDSETGIVMACETGVAGGTPVVLFGDSHAHQWLPAVQAIAEERNWAVSVFAKAGCPVQNIAPRADDSRFSDPECVTWRQASIDAIVNDIHPRLILVSSLHTYLPDTQEALAAWDDSLVKLRAAGAPIAYVRDTAHPTEDVPTCISSAFDDWSRCAFTHDGIEEPVIEQTIVGNQPGVSIVDLLPYFCDDMSCPAVRNGLLLYRDDSHITATASRALAPALEGALEENGVLP